MVVQPEVEPASTTDTNEGEDAHSVSAGVPPITITPASTLEHKVEVGISNILETNPSDVAAPSRNLASGCPVAQQSPEVGRHEDGTLEGRKNLEGKKHGAKTLLESLLPREGHYPSYAEATGIQIAGWSGWGRTAEEMLLELKGGKASIEREPDLALIIRGVETLQLDSSLPSGGSRTLRDNARGAGDDDGRAEREAPMNDEPQTKVVKEDVSATRAADEAQADVLPVSRPNESSSATIVEGTAQPRMKLQVESTAPTSSSLSSPSSYSSSSETPVSTPSAAHEPPEPVRRSKNGNPMDINGKYYIWNPWPLTRKKKPRSNWKSSTVNASVEMTVR